MQETKLVTLPESPPTSITDARAGLSGDLAERLSVGTYSAMNSLSKAGEKLTRSLEGASACSEITALTEQLIKVADAQMSVVYQAVSTMKAIRELESRAVTEIDHDGE